MEETILDWTVPNWITVILMVVLGYAVLGLLAGGAKKMMAPKEG